MSKPTFFTDEDIYAAVAVALWKAGLDVVSTPEAGRLGESDDSQCYRLLSPLLTWLTMTTARWSSESCAIARLDQTSYCG